MKTKTTEKTDSSKPVLEETYETEIEFTCPVRGLVKQKVKVKRYQGCTPAPDVDILPSKSVTDKLDMKYSGLILEDDTVVDKEDDV
jgi:hypothetical protein